MPSESSGLPETPQQLQRTSEDSPTYRERIPVERNNFLYYFGEALLSYPRSRAELQCKGRPCIWQQFAEFFYLVQVKILKNHLEHRGQRMQAAFFFSFFFLFFYLGMKTAPNLGDQENQENVGILLQYKSKRRHEQTVENCQCRQCTWKCKTKSVGNVLYLRIQKMQTFCFTCAKKCRQCALLRIKKNVSILLYLCLFSCV